MHQTQSSLFFAGIFLTVVASGLFFGALETDWWLGGRVIVGLFGLFFLSTGSYSLKKVLVRYDNLLLALVSFFLFAGMCGFLFYSEVLPFFARFFFGVLGIAIIWAIFQSWLNWRVYKWANHNGIISPSADQ